LRDLVDVGSELSREDVFDRFRGLIEKQPGHDHRRGAGSAANLNFQYYQLFTLI
jgi:hypothetical protein